MQDGWVQWPTRNAVMLAIALLAHLVRRRFLAHPLRRQGDAFLQADDGSVAEYLARLGVIERHVETERADAVGRQGWLAPRKTRSELHQACDQRQHAVGHADDLERLLQVLAKQRAQNVAQARRIRSEEHT